MNRPNEDHAAIDPDYSHKWVFVIPTNAERSGEHLKEITSIAKDIFQSSSNFLRPIQLSYFVRLYAKTHHYPFDDENAEPFDTLKRHLENDEGVSFEAFETSTEHSHDGPFRIPRISFDRNRVRIQLADGEHYLDRATKCVPYRAGEPLDREPSWDPLTITISHAPNLDYPAIDTEYVYLVSVELRSQIWFEPSPVGDVNRKHLSAFLERLAAALPFEKIQREPKRGLEYELGDIF